MKKKLFLILIAAILSSLYFANNLYAVSFSVVESVKFYKLGDSEKITFFLKRKIPKFNYSFSKYKKKILLTFIKTSIKKNKIFIPSFFTYIKSVSVQKTYEKNLRFKFLLSNHYLKIITYPLRNPNRVVVSIRRKKTSERKIKLNNRKSKINRNFLLKKNIRMKFLKEKGVIVIDPGHGGRDPGAIGVHGNNEKKINLDVSLRLFKLLKHKHIKNNKIYLTRHNDRYVSLNQRRRYSNRKNADLFISIHSNSSRRKSLNGIETYFYNRKASSKRSYRLALRENMQVKNIGTNLNKIFKDMWESEKIVESKKIAKLIQRSLVRYLRLNNYRVTDLGTKYAPFAVLKNSRRKINRDLFPPVSILIEIGFLSNKIESKKLSKASFRQRIAEGIAVGIKSYIMQ